MATVTTMEFLQTVYPEPVGPGKLLVRTAARRSGKRRSYWLNTLDEAARQGHRLKRSRDVYLGGALHDEAKALEVTRRRWPRVQLATARAAEESATALPALAVTLRASGDAPPPGREALELLAAVGVETSIVVRTGGGYDVYWLLRELWVLDGRPDRDRAKDLLRRLAGALRAEAADRGRPVDAGAGLGRMLRLPGTLDHSPSPPVAVTVERFPLVPGAAGGDRYGPDDFEHLPAAAELPAAEERLLGEAPPDPPPADFKAVYQGCGWLRHCWQDRRRLPEAEWRAALGLVGRAAWAGQDGRRLAHRFSQDHPGYNPQATDDTLDQALAEPERTCRHVAYRLGGHQAHCRRCPHFGRIETPLALGRGEAGESPAEGSPADTEPGAGAVEPAGSPEPPERPRIVITTREHEVNDQALAALAAREPNLFERAGRLVHVVPPQPAAGDACRRPAGAPVVRPLTDARVREMLAAHCELVKAPRPGKEPRAAHPPLWMVRALLERGSWPELPSLEGVVECPVLRPDGSVLQEPGYDAGSGLYLMPSIDFEPVPSSPTGGEKAQALERLREAVDDFPFETEAHRGAWLCSLLTPLARAAFAGPSPLNLIDANVRGCGKSLLADVCSVLVTGRPAARMSYSGNEDELRKAITAIALEATRLVLIDNLAGVVASPTLDRALTAITWRDRLLGANEQVTIPLETTWYATGNNLVLGADTPRRCLHVRLRATSERPEKRADFRHPRLLDWLSRERARLVPAALTLLRGYLADGRPPQGLEVWGSYESWSDLVRSCVVWLGFPDPAATREALESDAEQGVVHDLVHGLAQLLAGLGGVATAREIVARLAAAPARHRLLRSALAELFPRLKDGELPRPTQLAGKLRAYRGRMARGASIEQHSKSYQGARWTVRRAAAPATHDKEDRA